MRSVISTFALLSAFSLGCQNRPSGNQSAQQEGTLQSRTKLSANCSIEFRTIKENLNSTQQRQVQMLFHGQKRLSADVGTFEFSPSTKFLFFHNKANNQYCLYEVANCRSIILKNADNNDLINCNWNENRNTINVIYPDKHADTFNLK